MLVDGLLGGAAGRWPERTALVAASERLSYEALNAACDRLSAALQRLGVRRGDRVAIHLDNGAEAVIAIFGVLRAGAAFVLINPTTKAEKLGYILRDCEPRVLISERRTAQVVADALVGSSVAPVVVLTGIARESGVEIPEAVDFQSLLTIPTGGSLAGPLRIDLDLAALIYTSGSTGGPKGVMLTHANILSATCSINSYLGNGPTDVILNVLPLSFDYGLYQLFLAFQAGATVVLERSFTYPTVMLDLMVRERVTALPMVPMIAALLIRHDLTGWDLSSLRYITNTGAVLPPAHIAALRARLPHARLFSMYGLTECKRVSFLDPDQVDARPTSVGKPMDNVEVFVVDSDGRLASRGTGELVVRGANVMQGYWRAPEETARALKPGLFPGEYVLHTGDIFTIDDDGYMHFHHRLDDVIKSRGQKVSPREVENVLHSAPGVSEALVVGVPDLVAGESLKGYVTLHPGAVVSDQDLLLHCSKYLEDFMVPRLIEIVAELPHNASGKLARRQLQMTMGHT